MKQQNKTNTNKILNTLLIICLFIIIIIQYKSKNNIVYTNVNENKYHNNGNCNKVVMDYNSNNRKDIYCEKDIEMNKYNSYMNGMNNVYNNVINIHQTCLPHHKKCGWGKNDSYIKKELPLFVLSIGLEGSGHHYWTSLMNDVLECSWINGRHYFRDIGDGVPKTTTKQLAEALQEQLRLRSSTGRPPCKSIFDAEDSFPTGAIRKPGRVFMKPDLINLHELDGVMFNIKYLIILRNTTDTTISALRRNFFTSVDEGIRTVENTLTYIESALKIIPCHKIFIAHYEHILASPMSYFEPLSTFLELDNKSKNNLKRKLDKDGSIPDRKIYKLTQYKECKGIIEEDTCYNVIKKSLDEFFIKRNFMWPTFAGNGFNYI